MVSLRMASDVYGVVIDAESWRVDEVATENRRGQMLAGRRTQETPNVLWEEPGGAD